MTLNEVNKILKVLALVEAGQPVPPALLRKAIDAANRHADNMCKLGRISHENLVKAGVISDVGEW